MFEEELTIEKKSTSIMMKKRKNRKNEVNKSLVHYPDYPQREGVSNYPLPAYLSWELKVLESRMFNEIDEFFPMSRYEILTQTQYSILGGGVVNNFKEFVKIMKKFGKIGSLMKIVVISLLLIRLTYWLMSVIGYIWKVYDLLQVSH